MTIHEFISKHEGRRKKPYLDNAVPPKKTIGVGWNIDANPLPPGIATYLKAHGSITDDMIDTLLSISVGRAIADCHKLFPDFDGFTDNRRMALIDFIFQLGLTKSSCFVNSIKMINTGQWEEAGSNLKKSNWFTQVPSRAREVIDLIKEG